MKSEIILPGSKIKAEGRITIEYTDGITGEVKNKFESTNHIFLGGFNRQNNFAFGASSAEDASSFGIVLSDQNTDINYNIPWVPGNIIGHGYPGSAASGARVGAENTAARSLNIYSGGKWHYKRQWSWLPSQVKSTIKSFGIVPIAACTGGSDYKAKWHTCAEQLPYDGRGSISLSTSLTLYDHGIGYYIANQIYFSSKTSFQGSIRKYNLDTDWGETIYTAVNMSDLTIPSDIASSSPSYESQGSSMLAYDLDTEEVVLMVLYKDSSSIASVYEIRWDTHMASVKSTRIYKCGTYTKVSSSYPFSGYSGKHSTYTGYIKNGKLYALYGEPSTGLSLFAEVDPDAWSSSGNFLDAFSFVDVPESMYGRKPTPEGGVFTALQNGYVFFSAPYSRLTDLSANASSSGHVVVINPNSNKPYATRFLYFGQNSNNALYYGRPRMYDFHGSTSLIQHVAYYKSGSETGRMLDLENNYWRNLSDYTLYVLPSNAPVREEGQGVTITYEIAWGYDT